jgi:K+-transporting ATPase ATPase B chain
VTDLELADAAQLASLADETPEGRSIVVLAKEKYSIRGRDISDIGAKFVPFTAQSRMSGVDMGTSWVRKGAVDSVIAYLGGGPSVSAAGNVARAIQPSVSIDAIREINAIADEIAKAGCSALST